MSGGAMALQPERVLRVRVGDVVDRTEAEGPGVRFALWVRGCSLRCPGCCNPHLFDPRGPETEVAALVERLEAAREVHPALEGITLLGGEPFEQAEALAAFAAAARARGLSVVVFSGYTKEELSGSAAPPGSAALLALTDLLVDGRYRHDEPEGERRWAGSRNQRFHFLSERYSPGVEHEGASRTVELRVGTAGAVHLSGWPEPGLAGSLGRMKGRGQ